jgi:hypothetical protein
VFFCVTWILAFFSTYIEINFFLLEKWDFSLLKCIKQDKKQKITYFQSHFSFTLISIPAKIRGSLTSHNPWFYQSTYMYATLLIRIIKYLKGKPKTYRKGTVHVCLEHPNETQTRRQITTMDLKYFKLLVSIKKSREKKN